MGWRGLKPGAGVLFVPGGPIHTAFMRFPIDAVFVDQNGTVVSVAEHLRPWRLASGRGCRFVVELAAGEAERLGIKTGDQLGLAPGWNWEKLRSGRRLPVLRQASERNG
jgi:hypothetical protein